MRSVIVSALVAATVAVSPCAITLSGGKVLNFTSLINPAGAYRWSQTVYGVSGNLFTAIEEASPANYTFELQVCNAVSGSVNANCTAGSMINQINPDGSCYSFGSASVGTFVPNPYADGAYIAVYQGSQIDNVQAYSAHVYFICQQGQTGAFTYEHMKSTYQVHFSVLTPLAC